MYISKVNGFSNHGDSRVTIAAELEEYSSEKHAKTANQRRFVVSRRHKSD
jgi:hypothetical protein